MPQLFISEQLKMLSTTGIFLITTNHYPTMMIKSEFQSKIWISYPLLFDYKHQYKLRCLILGLLESQTFSRYFVCTTMYLGHENCQVCVKRNNQGGPNWSKYERRWGSQLDFMHWDYIRLRSTRSDTRPDSLKGLIVMRLSETDCK